MYLNCVILSRMLHENVECACMCQHFSPKLKFLDGTLYGLNSIAALSGRLVHLNH